MEFPGDSPLLRIGELSRRLGVSDHVLRAWENRYGLLQPVRSPGGFPLYSEADEWRIRRMQAYLADGLSAAEAARAALSGDASTPPGRPAGPPLAAPAGDGLSAALRQALDAFDEPAAQAVPDRLLADLSVPAVLRDVVLPYLADLGERWQRGTASVAMEHFASNRPARGAGPRLGERARPASPARLPARRAARYGADGFRHRAPPQRLADRLSRGEHPGRGAGASRRRLGSWPGRPGRYHPGHPRAAPPGARLTGPARPARPRRSRRHSSDRNCGGGQADRGRPGDRGRADRWSR